MLPTIAFLESVSSHWISQPRGRAKAVLPACREAITGTITFQVNVNGLLPGQEESNPALVLIPVQSADRPRRIQLFVCLVRQKLENLALAMRKPQLQTPTRKAAIRRKHEAQIGILALGALGVLLVLALRAPQIGATSTLDACYAPYAVAKRLPFAESCAKLTCGGGTHPPQPCDARLNSVVCTKRFLT